MANGSLWEVCKNGKVSHFEASKNRPTHTVPFLPFFAPITLNLPLEEVSGHCTEKLKRAFFLLAWLDFDGVFLHCSKHMIRKRAKENHCIHPLFS